jgi:NAD(P)-dependent dehydrogenase (short-subunit alcohol dehydrogenase family)
MLDMMGQFSPMGRVGQPEDIGNTILFLCSEMSAYITGQMINVSGGIPLSRYNPERGFMARRPPEGERR